MRCHKTATRQWGTRRFTNERCYTMHCCQWAGPRGPPGAQGGTLARASAQALHGHAVHRPYMGNTCTILVSLLVIGHRHPSPGARAGGHTDIRAHVHHTRRPRARATGQTQQPVAALPAGTRGSGPSALDDECSAVDERQRSKRRQCRSSGKRCSLGQRNDKGLGRGVARGGFQQHSHHREGLEEGRGGGCAGPCTLMVVASTKEEGSAGAHARTHDDDNRNEWDSLTPRARRF